MACKGVRPMLGDFIAGIIYRKLRTSFSKLHYNLRVRRRNSMYRTGFCKKNNESYVYWITNLNKLKVRQPDLPCDFYCLTIKINFQFTWTFFNDIFRHDSCHHQFIVLCRLTLSLDDTQTVSYYQFKSITMVHIALLQ